MAKVLCKLPNASTNISGIRFVTHRDGMISEEIDDAIAKKWATVPGYEIYDPAQTDQVAAAILENARKTAAQGQGQNPNPQPPAPPAGAPSSPPAGAATPPAGSTPAAPPAGAPAGGTAAGQGDAGKDGTPDPKF